jgi:type I restriction enzyme, S subunit
MMASMHPLFDRRLPSGWRVLTADEVKANEPSSCVAGPFGSNISSKYFVDDGVPVIRGNNLRDDLTQFVAEGFVFVSCERAQSYRAQHVRAGDLVFTCWGTIGQVGLIPRHGPYPEYIISNKQLKLRPNRELVDFIYLFYYFASPQMVQHIKSRAIGAAVPGINLGILKALPVVAPPIQTQRRIADILSAYDDFIENNTKRIKILEEMARSLYREWFVQFRFPGHEKVKFVESRMGLVPHRWTVKTVAETFEIVGGGTPSKEVVEYWDGGELQWFTPSDLTAAGTMFIDASGAKITALGLAKSSAHLFPARSVMMTSRATIGAIAVNTTPASTNQGFITCIPSREYPLWILFHWLKENVPQFLRLAGGATFKEITKGTFKQIELLVPPRELAARYEQTVEPITEQVLRFQRKNGLLRTARDLLLPRLISGEIDVSSLSDPAA